VFKQQPITQSLMNNLYIYHGENKSIFNEMMMMRSANLDFYSASSLKQQSAGRHVAPLGHIILISNPRCTALEAIMLIITPPMRLYEGIHVEL